VPCAYASSARTANAALLALLAPRVTLAPWATLGLASPPATAAPAPGATAVSGVRRGRTLVFPRDHGAHPDTRTEWWYATGWLGAPAAPTHGFQVTFFRSRTGLAADSTSRFAARQVLFAHAAVTDLAARRHLHAARIARWNGDPRARPDFAAVDDAALQIGRWWLRREDGELAARYRVDSAGFYSAPEAASGVLYAYGRSGTVEALRAGD